MPKHYLTEPGSLGAISHWRIIQAPCESRSLAAILYGDPNESANSDSNTNSNSRPIVNGNHNRSLNGARLSGVRSEINGSIRTATVGVGLLFQKNSTADLESLHALAIRRHDPSHPKNIVTLSADLTENQLQVWGDCDFLELRDLRTDRKTRLVMERKIELLANKDESKMKLLQI